MFGWCGGLGIATVGLDPEQERRPPSAPTNLDFPLHKGLDATGSESESSLRQIGDLLASIKRPQDISSERFKAFNLKVELNIPATCIVRRDSTSRSPLLPWEDSSSNPSPSLDDGSPVLLENGDSYPPKERFEVLKDELLMDNDDVFREVGRLPPREGRQRVRVTQTRKFWTGLERMSQYWDSSLDHYYERPATPQQQGPAGDSGGKMQTDNGTQPVSPNETEVSMDLEAPAKTNDQVREQSECVTMYKGRRTGCGSEMPEDIREETIRALAEMAAWPFGCQVALPIMPPRLTVKTLLFPVRQTFTVARSPKDRQLARSGVMEGPLLVAQCRPETSFRVSHEAPGSGTAEICDLFREVGGMLLTAQERLRQGTAEVRPGEGKWWTTSPRWGGAPNDAVGDSGNCNDIPPTPESGNARKRSKYEHPFLASRRPAGSRKLSNSERWKLVQPGPSLWDRRMRYIQIGKGMESPFDDIYMLSSINHHLAILHLQVHRRYIEILTTGDSDFPPDTDTPDQPWLIMTASLKGRHTEIA
ncbi:hypothetical protein EYZ11_012580 [Aspergillus tanneri]|uniref:Uncharacterized protein n=1 Tax=Aspergillus tanneri TaxID=1220188 RepID=A0A4S3J0F4_9EURO|nr:hypothetical protein EYZ11_012580 [Aspergillus tanneri]